MPDAFAGCRIEGQEAVREKVIARAVRSIEVKRGRSGGHEHQTTLLIERQTWP